MIRQNNPQVHYEKSSAAVWLIVCALLLLGAVFFIRQLYYVPVDARTVKDFMLDESKQQVSPLKKYFPQPYSVKDLAGGEYDRH
jgi:hypothetical protein